MPTGTIKKLVADRGFGFIAAEDGKEFFFHRSGTEGDFDSLRGGEKVTFEIEVGEQALQVQEPRRLGVGCAGFDQLPTVLADHGLLG